MQVLSRIPGVPHRLILCVMLTVSGLCESSRAQHHRSGSVQRNAIGTGIPYRNLPSGSDLYSRNRQYGGAHSTAGWNAAVRDPHTASRHHHTSDIYFDARDHRLANRYGFAPGIANTHGYWPNYGSWPSYGSWTGYDGLTGLNGYYSYNVNGWGYLGSTYSAATYFGPLLIPLPGAITPYYTSPYGVLGPQVSYPVPINGVNPFGRSTASYTVTPNPATVAPNNMAAGTDFNGLPPKMRVTPVPEMLPDEQFAPLPNAVPLHGPEPRIPSSTDETPVVNEFPAAPLMQKQVTAADRIQSIRYQATGDQSFRSGEYASAEVFYRTAVQTAPGRQAPYIRLAMVLVARQQFEKAVGWLKTGLLIQGDPTRGGVKSDELYGSEFGDVIPAHAERLFQWLDQKPLSVDRLLLVSAFQSVRQQNASAEELLQVVLQLGEADAYVAAIQKLHDSVDTDGYDPSPISPDHAVSAAPSTSLPPGFRMSEVPERPADRIPIPETPVGAAEPAKREGIFMKGRNQTPDSHVDSPGQ
ncbi:MAG: tetratricopeptide repeat protein [Planctomycetaceae bacterium]